MSGIQGADREEGTFTFRSDGARGGARCPPLVLADVPRGQWGDLPEPATLPGWLRFSPDQARSTLCATTGNYSDMSAARVWDGYRLVGGGTRGPGQAMRPLP